MSLPSPELNRAVLEASPEQLLLALVQRGAKTRRLRDGTIRVSIWLPSPELGEPEPALDRRKLPRRRYSADCLV